MLPRPPLIPDRKGSGARPYSSVMIPTYNPRAEYPKEILRGVLAQTFLRASGRVVASVPNAPHWTMRLNLLPGRFDYQPAGIIDATHLRWFTVRSLHRFSLKRAIGSWRVKLRWAVDGRISIVSLAVAASACPDEAYARCPTSVADAFRMSACD